MKNEPNDKNKLTNELRKRIQDSVKNSFDKNVGGRGTENAGISRLEKRITDDFRESEREGRENYESVKRNANNVLGQYKDKGNKAYNEELKREEVARKAREEAKKRGEVVDGRSDYSGGTDDVSSPRSPEALRSGLAADRARIQGSEAREAEAQRIKKDAIKKAEKDVNREIQKHSKMRGAKGEIAARIASKAVGEAAYVVASKMAERANAGGPGAIVVILITLVLVVITDAVDIFGTVKVVAAIATVIGIPLGAIAGALLWLFNLFCNLTVVVFWVFILGGGHKKYFWKRVIRMVIGLIGLECIPGLDLFPFGVLMVCWNWYDFAKDKKKAKNDLAAFESEFKNTRKIKPEYVGEYA